METKTVKLKNIKKISSNSKRYDIGVKNNHNFFANDILVHNSLGIVFYWEGRWCVATKGSFQSEQAIWATKWLYINVYTEKLDVNKTYLTEIIYPSNKIVVSYSFEGLVLLGGYDLDSGLEVSDLADTWKVAFNLDRKPKTYQYNSLDEMLKIAETLDVNNEGFVVRFSNGYRIKIKGAEYVRVHRLISNCTPLAIWDMMRNLDDLDIIRKDLPEEHQRDFDKIRALLQDKFYDYIKVIKSFYEETKELSDKELGIKLKLNHYHLTPKIARTFVFACRKKNFLSEVYEIPNGQKYARRTLFETFRPTGNILEGFEQSSAMNRFDTENL
jgi:RNA ligase